MEQQEPELIDYLAALWRWKWLIVIGVVAGLLGAGLVTWGRPPTQRLVATIDGGDVSEQELERLVVQINYGTFREGQEELWPARRIGAEIRRPFVIQLSLDGGSPAVDAPILARTAGRVVAELTRLLSVHQEQDEAELRAIRAQIARRESVKSLREARVQTLRRSVDRLRKAQADLSSRVSDPGATVVVIHLLDDIEAKEAMLAEVEGELAIDIPERLLELGRQAEVITRRLAAVRQPRLAAAPESVQAARSRPKLNLALGLTAGLLGSVLLALLLEYLRVSRKRLTQAAG